MKHVTIILEDKGNAIDLTVYGVDQENPKDQMELLALAFVKTIQKLMNNAVEKGEEEEDDQG